MLLDRTLIILSDWRELINPKLSFELIYLSGVLDALSQESYQVHPIGMLKFFIGFA